MDDLEEHVVASVELSARLDVLFSRRFETND
jgi:hypothetical protein